LEIFNQFNKEAENIAFNLKHRDKINFNIAKYDEAVIHAKEQYFDLEKAKRRAAFLKYKVINDLDKYLIKFEDNFSNGLAYPMDPSGDAGNVINCRCTWMAIYQEEENNG